MKFTQESPAKREALAKFLSKPVTILRRDGEAVTGELTRVPRQVGAGVEVVTSGGLVTIARDNIAEIRMARSASEAGANSRSKLVAVRFTHAEHEQLVAFSRDTGASVSDLIRRGLVNSGWL